MTRRDGRLIRITIGKYPAISLADARKQARSTALLVSRGKDPRRVRADESHEAAKGTAEDFGTCAAEFLKKHVKRRLRPSTQREYRRILLGNDTRDWRDRPISQISKRDVLDVIEGIDSRGSPGASKRALVYIRKFFNWCAERDIIATVPTNRIRPPHPEVKRDRVLTEGELRDFLRALDSEASSFGPLVRILLFTGQRRAEVAGMLWSELRDLKTDVALWKLPARAYEEQARPLGSVVVGCSRDLHRFTHVGDLVFTTTGTTPPSGFGKAKARLDARIGAWRAARVSSCRCRPGPSTTCDVRWSR